MIDKKYILASVLLMMTLSALAQTDTSFQYRRPLFDFKYEEPVFALNKAQLENKQKFLRSMVITGYREGVQPISGIMGANFSRLDDPENGTATIQQFNLSIVELIERFPAMPSRVVLEVKDPSKYMYLPAYGNKEIWMRKNALCYEYTMPAALAGKKPKPNDYNFNNQFMSSLALQQQLGIRSKKEDRMLKTLVLVRTSADEAFKSDGGTTSANLEKGNYRNDYLGALAYSMRQYCPVPFVNESGFADDQTKVDMELNISDWSDIPALRRSLQRYGFDLKEEMREIKDVLVITEIKEGENK